MDFDFGKFENEAFEKSCKERKKRLVNLMRKYSTNF